MAEDEDLDDLAGLDPDQLSDEFARDLARRWDPDRLLQLVAARAGKGESLDHTVRQRYERKLGIDLGHVRLYTGEFAEEFNKRRNADAVTIGGTGMILMGGTADRSMATAAGPALLAHELTHVAQAERGLQRSGRGADMELATEEHEAEAEEAEQAEMAEQGVGEAAAAPSSRDAAASANAAQVNDEVVQRVIDMLGEAMRVLIDRSGPGMRRP